VQLIEMMKLFRNWVCLAVLAGAGFGQDPGAVFLKAPPDKDEALRARITKFYQAHVDGKFRAADEMVAEDSKDVFFAAEKPHCRAFQIMTITYSENFTRAVVLVSCDTEMPVMMAGRIPVKMPLRSLWKTVDGQWFYYVDPVPDREATTPFGTHKPSDPGQAGVPEGMPGAVTIEAVLKMVKADRQEVRFNPAVAGAEKVVITSQMAGSVALRIEGDAPPGLELSFDRMSLRQGQSAALTIRYLAPKGIQPVDSVVTIVVSPMDQPIPVRVRFGPPAP
jgi:hypothetical protein